MSSFPGDEDEHSCRGLLPWLLEAEGEKAICDGATGTWLTRGQLRETALALAAWLASPRRQLVFVFADQSWMALACVLAAAAAGHAVAILDDAMTQAKRLALVEAYRPEFLFALDARGLSALEAHGYGPPQPLDHGVILAKRATADAAGPEIHPSTLLLLTTSGTTGAPRFVRLSQSAVVANARQIAQALNVDARSVGVAHLPFHYSYGWSVVASHLVTGGRLLILGESLLSKSFWEAVARVGGTHFPGVPFHYATLARLGLHLLPDCLNTFTQAGGALDLKIQDRMHEFAQARGARFLVMYGQTEAAPRMTTLPHEAFAHKRGSVGRALPEARLVIVKDTAEAETGEVVFHGPNVMLGYAETRVDLARGDEMNGRLETGDIGRIDEDGYLYLSGRSKRFVKIAGLRIGLDAMEKEFAGFGSVACFDRNESIVVCFETATESEIKARARDLAVEYKIPPNSFLLRRVEAVPRTGGGKIDYARLKADVNV